MKSETNTWKEDGKERRKSEADRSGFVGGRCSKQGSLHMRLVSGAWKTSRSLHPTSQIFKALRVASAGFSHIYHPHGLISTLPSQGFVVENISHRTVGSVDRMYIPRAREGGRNLWLPRSSLQVNRKFMSSR